MELHGLPACEEQHYSTILKLRVNSSASALSVSVLLYRYWCCCSVSYPFPVSPLSPKTESEKSSVRKKNPLTFSTTTSGSFSANRASKPFLPHLATLSHFSTSRVFYFITQCQCSHLQEEEVFDTQQPDHQPLSAFNFHLETSCISVQARWAPYFAPRRCTSASCFSSQRMPTIASLSWESSA